MDDPATVDKLLKCKWFDYDKNGKLIPVPVNVLQILKSSEKKPPKLTPLPPLVLSKSEREIMEPPTKLRKTDCGAKRELFKAPTANPTIPKKLNNRTSNVRKSRVMASDKTTKPPARKSGKSMGYQFKEIKKPQIKFNNTLKPPSNGKLGTPRRPPISSKTAPTTPMGDFLRMERICEEKENSPMTSMCNMMESTKLTKNDDLQAIQEIRNKMVELDQNFQTFQTYYKKKQHEIMAGLDKILATRMPGTPAQINVSPVRRSPRLVGRNLSSTFNRQVSPCAEANTDLRRMALMKNIPKTLSTPKIKRAVNLFNVMEGSYAPTLNSDTKTFAGIEPLSTTLKEQCFSLQETPLRTNV